VSVKAACGDSSSTADLAHRRNLVFRGPLVRSLDNFGYEVAKKLLGILILRE
jgi:hypothetical protein